MEKKFYTEKLFQKKEFIALGIMVTQGNKQLKVLLHSGTRLYKHCTRKKQILSVKTS